MRFDEAEHPVALQLGGSDPKALAEAAAWGERFGYDEININVGCPSDRVQNGRFGACLMAEPDLVADTVRAIGERVGLPVTVKTRIGIDDRDDYGFLRDFIGKIADAGCEHVIIHARKAILSGLSPKENREIPPLDYPRVHRLKRDFPELTVILNGGLKTPSQILAEIDHVDGVMIGREAYQNPYALLGMEQALFGPDGDAPSRHEIVRRFLDYVETERTAGVPLKSITRHVLGLFNGLPGARAWRRHLSEEAVRDGAGPEVIEQALSRVPEARRRPKPPSAKGVPSADLLEVIGDARLLQEDTVLRLHTEPGKRRLHRRSRFRQFLRSPWIDRNHAFKIRLEIRRRPSDRVVHLGIKLKASLIGKSVETRLGPGSHLGLVIHGRHHLAHRPTRTRLGDMQTPARLQHTPGLGQRGLLQIIRHMVKGKHETDEIGAANLQRQVLAPAEQNADVGMHSLLGDRDLGVVDLDARYLGAPLGEGSGELAVPRANIDDSEAVEIDQ